MNLFFFFFFPLLLSVLVQNFSPSEFAGFVEFCAPGNQQVRLWADKNDKDELFIVFKDQTAKTGETYGAGRFLYAQVEKDNSVTLDFNRGYNPACAFTEFALCPLPGSFMFV